MTPLAPPVMRTQELHIFQPKQIQYHATANKNTTNSLRPCGNILCSPRGSLSSWDSCHGQSTLLRILRNQLPHWLIHPLFQDLHSRSPHCQGHAKILTVLTGIYLRILLLKTSLQLWKTLHFIVIILLCAFWEHFGCTGSNLMKAICSLEPGSLRQDNY